MDNRIILLEILAASFGEETCKSSLFNPKQDTRDEIGTKIIDAR